MASKLIWFHCLSPLHAGVGQGVDVVDLAIARERATGFPYLPGSSIKGSLRARACRAKMAEPRVNAFFGSAAGSEDDKGFAGSLSFGDARLLCLPVRSFVHTFAYVTSPYLLRRLARDLAESGVSVQVKVPESLDDAEAHVAGEQSKLVTSMTGTDAVILEDYDLKAKRCPTAEKWSELIAERVFAGDEAAQKSFQKRFVVVSDTMMSFLATHATEVVTRVSIDDDSGIVADGQLWTEENLPAESILVSMVHATPVNAAKLENTVWEEFSFVLGERPVEQFGGNATVGRGRCALALTPSADGGA